MGRKATFTQAIYETPFQKKNVQKVKECSKTYLIFILFILGLTRQNGDISFRNCDVSM